MGEMLGSCSPHSCYCIPPQGRDVVARVQIAQLSDFFIKDFQSAFTRGQCVTGRILSVDTKRKQLEMSLKSSVVNPDKFSAPLTLEDLKP